MSGRILVVGVGSPFGDDQLGWIAVERLRATDVWNDKGVSFCDVTSPIRMMDMLDGVGKLVVVDACLAVGAVGTITRWSWPDARFEQTQFTGTHDFPLVASLQLAERLKKLPAQVLAWTITVENPPLKEAIPSDSGLSLPVAEVLPEFVDPIAADLLGAAPCTNNPL